MTQLPFNPTTYSFVLQSCINDEYVYTRPDLYILIINPEKEYFLIRYYNINQPGVNIELFRGWLPTEEDFVTVMNLVKP